MHGARREPARRHRKEWTAAAFNRQQRHDPSLFDKSTREVRPARQESLAFRGHHFKRPRAKAAITRPLTLPVERDDSPWHQRVASTSVVFASSTISRNMSRIDGRLLR